MDIPGFPNFGPLVAELSDTAASDGTAGGDAFKVTSLHPSGNLIIQEQFFQQFGKEESETCQEFIQLVEAHNETYNSDNLRLTERPASSTKNTEVVKTQVLEPEDGKDVTPEKIASIANASLDLILHD